MDPRLIDYYNNELAHVREMGAEFAREFPKVAARLGMEGVEVADPYVERLLEGFAFIAARVQLKTDAEFPRFTQHLLEMLFPQYLAPMPSCMLVEMKPDAGDPALLTGFPLARGSAIRSIIPRGEQTACEFRTAHALRLWPLAVASARYFTYASDLPLGALGLTSQVRGGVRVRLAMVPELPMSALRCDELSFFIAGADDVASSLHELAVGHAVGALLMSNESPPRVLARLPASAIGADGFDDDQALLPFDRRSFQGYRLLREYFALPQRFRFLKVAGLAPGFADYAGRECELVLLFGRGDTSLEPVIDESHFALHTTPVVNAFRRRADRVHLSEGRFEHHLVIDRARPMDFEVLSISELRGLTDDGTGDVDLRPFYGDLVHHDSVGAKGFYTMRRASRMLSERQRRQGTRSGYVGTEVFLSIVDEREAPYPVGLKQLAVDVVATNRDLPLLLPIGSLNALMLDETAPVQGMKVHKAPTRPRASLVEGDFAWRLLSHLSLNYLSLLDGDRQGSAAASLRELLLLYTDLADPASRRQADSVTKVTSRPIIRRMPVAGPIAFGRGLEIDLTLDESAFGGSGGFILGSVLERLLARHVSINSFTQMRLHSESRGEVARWPARSGSRVIG